MQAFTRLNARALPLPRDNIDTDIIIPARFLKSVSRKGMGEGAFWTLRFREDGTADPDSVFAKPRFSGAEILVAGENFGCGSSREHAAWALADLGIRCVIAAGFADIFASNAFKNGILTVTLDRAALAAVLREAEQARALDIDLDAQQVRLADGSCFDFEIDPFRKQCLLGGLDEVALTLAGHSAAIDAFEARRRAQMPWLDSA